MHRDMLAKMQLRVTAKVHARHTKCAGREMSADIAMSNVPSSASAARVEVRLACEAAMAERSVYYRKESNANAWRCREDATRDDAFWPLMRFSENGAMLKNILDTAADLRRRHFGVVSFRHAALSTFIMALYYARMPSQVDFIVIYCRLAYLSHSIHHQMLLVINIMPAMPARHFVSR